MREGRGCGTGLKREGAATRGGTARSEVHLKRGKKPKCQANTVMEEEVYRR